jgi:hypothetical protein
VAYYLCGMLCSAWKYRLGRCLIKNWFRHSKMKNALFIGQKEKNLHRIPRHPKVHARVIYGLARSTYTMIKVVTQLIWPKTMQPLTCYRMSVKRVTP